MIGTIGDPRRDGQSSFGNLIAYCEKDGRSAYTGMQNIHFPERAASEMESLAFKNSRCQDPLMHVISCITFYQKRKEKRANMLLLLRCKGKEGFTMEKSIVIDGLYK